MALDKNMRMTDRPYTKKEICLPEESSEAASIKNMSHISAIKAPK
jgi:hypothetical protein